MHPADITIADFWKIDSAIPGFNDDKGVSLVLINNEKGEKVFDLIKNQAEAILSQQKTIENLASKVKEPIVPQEGNAMNADAAGFSEK